MAKVTDQSIPSEDRILYKRQCQISTDSRGVKFVRSRYPWRVPISQEGGRAVSPGQITQRDKFKLVKNKYATIDAATKQRWVDANPEYKSYLYGYNFFMMEGLTGGGTLEYPQMIKSIQVIKESVPTTGTKSFSISTVDPVKTVVMIQGNSVKWASIQRGSSSVTDGGSNNHALSPSVDPSVCEVIVNGQGGSMEISDGSGEGDWAAPYASALSSSQLTVAMVATGMTIVAGYSWQVIEHKEAIIYPVLVSVAANAVVIDWATVPSMAADVSITVVEYL